MDQDNNDLPLSANILDIRVRHYVFLLCPSFCTHIINGKLILVMSRPTACEKFRKCCSHACGCSISTSCIGLECSQDCSCSEKLNHNSLDFRVILDSSNLQIHSVSEVLCDKKDLSPYLDSMFVKENSVDSREWFSYDMMDLHFELDSSSLQVWKQGVKCAEHFPAVICIEYHTLPEGKSLAWHKDANSNLCFFVCGSPLNNRSLFPYQDAPSAMATWEANVLTEASYHVSMTGDKKPTVTKLDASTESLICFDFGQSFTSEISSSVNTQHNVTNCSYYYTALPLPMCTLAIAVGKWKVHTVISLDETKQATLKCSDQACMLLTSLNSSSVSQFSCRHSPYPCVIMNTLKDRNQLESNFASSSMIKEGHQESEGCGTLLTDDHHNALLPTTIVYPESLKCNVGPLIEFLPHCLSAASQLFGPHPCCRLEVVILPATFSSLGLASPNLVFLSPSIVMAGDTSMFIRTAHEISHLWFGIIIGAEDWTEEWLSEGFATFAEEAIFEKSFSTFLHPLERTEPSPLHQQNTSLRIPMTGQGQEGFILVSPTNKASSSKRLCVVPSNNVTTDQCDAAETYSLHTTSMEAFVQGQKRPCPGLLKSYPEPKYSCGSSQLTEGVECHEGHSCKKSLCKTLLAFNDDKLLKDLALLRTHLRFRNLLQEVDVSAEELQTLQPNKPSENSTVVPNGLQKDKGFLKIHYIKGYFLLKYLSTSVGEEDFLNFLKAYVLKYHGQLVTAREFIDYFYNNFPQFSAITSKNELIDLWLQQPGVNDVIRNHFGNIKNHLIDLCQSHCHYWILRNRKSSKSKPFSKPLQFSDQVHLFLELLVEQEAPLKKSIMSEIENMYNLDEENSDVRHAWCELIIKHKYYAKSEFVQEFLKKEFAMGVYLYGELMIAHSKVWKNLARSVFEEVKESMDINTRTVVQEMIYPE